MTVIGYSFLCEFFPNLLGFLRFIKAAVTWPVRTVGNDARYILD